MPVTGDNYPPRKGKKRVGEEKKNPVGVKSVPAAQMKPKPTPGGAKEKTKRRREKSYGGTNQLSKTEKKKRKLQKPGIGGWTKAQPQGFRKKIKEGTCKECQRK